MNGYYVILFTPNILLIIGVLAFLPFIILYVYFPIWKWYKRIKQDRKWIKGGG